MIYINRTVKVSAALDVTPLFILAGTVIPTADPRIMTVNNATNSSVITWQNLKVYTLHTSVHTDILTVFRTHTHTQRECSSCTHTNTHSDTHVHTHSDT